MSTQTPQSLSRKTPRKQKFRAKIRSLQTQVAVLKKKVSAQEQGRSTTSIINTATFQDFKQLCDKFLPSKCAEFVKLQADLYNKGPKQRRYNQNFLQICLKIYFMGPKAYRNISQIFTLPTKRTLNRLTQNINIKPGLNEAVFQSLEQKVCSFAEIDKNCLICLDEMSIKSHLFYDIGKDEIIGFVDYGNDKILKPSLHALVVIVKGIYNNWKQPLAYFFVHETCPPDILQNIVERIITKLFDIGLKVRVLVNDMGSSNIKVCNNFNIKEDNPVFYINGQQIIYMFDVPHLIKAVRNNFQKHNFCYNGKLTSWQHVVQFYNSDKILLNRLAPKLTDAHVNPTNREKMKVYLAAQVLSATVAAGMNTHVALQKLSTDAIGTIEFIELFDRLFDVMNSSQTTNAKEFNRAFKGLDYQVQFLKQCLNFLENVKVLNLKNEKVTHRIKSLRCFRITINGLLLLWKTLVSVGFEYLFTRRLCQDVVENFFGAIRQQGGNAINPTPIQFKRAFKKLFSVDFFAFENQNCLPDFDEILKLKVTNVDRYDTAATTNTTLIHLNLKDCDYRFHADEQNAIRYICGYLIKKCLNVHTCQKCEEFANAHQNLDETTLYSQFRAYQTKNLETFGKLYMPQDNFFYYVCELEQIFVENFEKTAVLDNVLTTLIELYKAVHFQHPCEDFPHNYLLRLYSRMRLFYCLKFINRNFRTTDEGKKMQRKRIIWQHS